MEIPPVFFRLLDLGEEQKHKLAMAAGVVLCKGLLQTKNPELRETCRIAISHVISQMDVSQVDELLIGITAPIDADKDPELAQMMVDMLASALETETG